MKVIRVICALAFLIEIICAVIKPETKDLIYITIEIFLLYFIFKVK